MTRLIVIITLLLAGVVGQELHSPVIKGAWDAHSATRTLPHRSGTGSPDARDNCTVVGETYFRTDAVAGSNSFSCTTTGTPGTWTLQGGGASSFPQLTDNSTTATSTVATHAAGSVRNSIGGKYTTDATVYTITHSSGTDNCNFRVYWDMSVDPPVKTFMRETGCGSGNWALSAGSFVVGSAFPVGTSLPLSTIPVTAGVLGTPVLYRTGDTASAPPCGTGLVANGVNCDVSGVSRGIGIAFDGGGSALTTRTGYVTVPFACSITAWNINVDAGTATFKLWRKATGTAIPTISDTLNTSGTAISSGTSVHSTTLSDFSSTAIAKNDIVGYNLSAVATATFASITYECVQ